MMKLEMQSEDHGLYVAAGGWMHWCENSSRPLNKDEKQILWNFMNEVQDYIISQQKENGDFTW